MTIDERKRKCRAIKRKRLLKQKIALMIVSICMITIGSVAFGSIFSAAKDSASNIQEYKYYKSIVIEKGDSLWSIAKQYNHESLNNHDYVKELKELNGLTSETIHAGQHLLITYYDTELH